MATHLVPPPIIDSARVLAFANVSEEVEYTGRIHLYVGDERLGRVANLAICRNYCKPDDILLLFCDEAWESRGCICFASIEEAMLKAEAGYTGISAAWKEATYNDAAVAEFLREVYEVDPSSEWWSFRCSFCRENVEGQGFTRGWATICVACVDEFHSAFHSADA